MTRRSSTKPTTRISIIQRIRRHPARYAWIAIAVVVGASPFLARSLGTAALVVAAVAAFFLVLRCLRLDSWLIALILAGVAVDAMYLTYTQYSERNYDAYDQIFYIHTIADEGRLPAVSSCGICHHPPGYYLLAAAWTKATAFISWIPYTTRLQILSIALFQVFVVTCVFVWKRFVSRPWTLRLACALLVFWPYSIMMSVRVHDDVLVTALMALAIYFMVEWYHDGAMRAFYLALGACALAMLTKSSGAIVASCLLAFVAWRSRSTPQARRLLVLSCAALFLVAIATTANKRDTAHPSLCFSVLGQACRAAESPQLRVNNGLRSFIGFDARGFLATPFIDAYRPETGIEYFWTDLLKSSLFGTYAGRPDPEMSVPVNLAIAQSLNAVFLAMVLLAFVGFVGATREAMRRYVPLLFIGGLFVLSVAALRIALPTAHHTDFRFVFPLLMLGCLAYAKATERVHRWRRSFTYLPVGLAGIFVALSVAFFAPKVNVPPPAPWGGFSHGRSSNPRGAPAHYR